jgi:hypothetical protein
MTTRTIDYVTFTTSSKSLSDLGITAQADLQYLVVVPDVGVSVTWALGSAATAGSAPVPETGIASRFSQFHALRLRFYGSGNGQIHQVCQFDQVPDPLKSV